MSELVVGSIAGLAANDYVVSVASGSQLTQPGMVLQIVEANESTFASTTNTSLTDTGLSVSITPTSASSKLFIQSTFRGGTSGSGAVANLRAQFAIADSSNTVLAEDVILFDSALERFDTSVVLTHYMTAGSTSSLTFKTQFAQQVTGYPARYAGDNGVGRMIVMEIAT